MKENYILPPCSCFIYIIFAFFRKILIILKILETYIIYDIIKFRRCQVLWHIITTFPKSWDIFFCERLPSSEWLSHFIQSRMTPNVFFKFMVNSCHLCRFFKYISMNLLLSSKMHRFLCIYRTMNSFSWCEYFFCFRYFLIIENQNATLIETLKNYISSSLSFLKPIVRFRVSSEQCIIIYVLMKYQSDQVSNVNQSHILVLNVQCKHTTSNTTNKPLEGARMRISIFRDNAYS